MKKILVTGFEPFNNRDINPSGEVVKMLEAPEGTSLVKFVLPVEFGRSAQLLTETVQSEKPDCILSFGQAGNAPWLAVERLAVNVDSCLSSDGKTVLADMSGNAPLDDAIEKNGPAACFAGLPVFRIVNALNDAGVPARVSYSAGTYVCNHVMYTGCRISERAGNMISGFIHLPFLPEQLDAMKIKDGRFAMPFETMLKGAQTAVELLAQL